MVLSPTRVLLLLSLDPHHPLDSGGLPAVARIRYLTPLLGQPITCLWGTHITQLAYVQSTKSRFIRTLTLSQDLTVQLS